MRYGGEAIEVEAIELEVSGSVMLKGQARLGQETFAK